jgi:hypothetical protein
LFAHRSIHEWPRLPDPSCRHSDRIPKKNAPFKQ